MSVFLRSESNKCFKDSFCLEVFVIKHLVLVGRTLFFCLEVEIT